MEYAWKSITGDMQKIGLLYLLAVPFHQGLYLTAILLSMIVIRMYVGGIHMRTYWSCFSMTAVWIVVGMILGRICVLHNEYLLFIVSIVTMVGVWFSGITISSKRKRVSEKELKKRKHIAMVLEVIIIGLSFVFVSNKEWRTGLLIGLNISNLQAMILKIILQIKSQKGERT